jgi:large subunit ribosomal protein L24
MTIKSTNFKTKLRKDDEVIVLSGKDKGKTGKIISFLTAKNRVIVKGINLVKDTKKAKTAEEKSQFITREASIHISNIAYYCLEKKVASKICYLFDDNDKKRFVKKESKTI